MRIKSIKVGGFGCLKDWTVGNLDSNLIIIYGNNESGKSTLFNMIETLFYGWKPVTNNPYIPWDGSNASIEAEIIDGNGDLMLVQRIIRSRAEGKVIKGEISFDIRNNPLDILAFMPREIFSDVYSLTLDKLCFPDSNAWQELQDQLLGGRYTSFIKPVSKVISELENESVQLWRPDNRGKPEAKEIQKRIAELKRMRKDALENEEELRIKEQKLYELNEQLGELNKEKAVLHTYLIRSERLLPVKKKLERIKELRDKAGDILKYNNLPDNPEEVLKNIREEIKEIELEIEYAENQNKGYKNIISSFTKEDQLVINQSDEIGKVTKSYAQIESDKEEIDTLKSGLRRNLDRITDQASNFLVGGWKSELGPVLKSIDEVELRSGINSFKDTQDRCKEKKFRLEGLRAQNGGTDQRILSWVSLITILLGLAGTLSLGNTPLGFASALLMVLGFGLGIFWFFNKGRNPIKAELEKVEKGLSELDNELKERRETVKKALKGLPVPLERLESPDETLLVDIKNIKNLIEQKSDIENKMIKVIERLEKREEEIKNILTLVGISSSRDILEDLRILEKRLSDAKERQLNAENATAAAIEIEDKIKGLKEEKTKLKNKHNDIINNLQGLNGKDIGEKIEDLLLRRDYIKRAQTLRDDLEREYPDLAKIELEINNLKDEEGLWDFSDSKLAEAKIKRDDIEEELGELKEEIGRLETDIKHLSNQARLDDIEGEINRLTEERKAVAVKRDRLIFLQNLLKEADRRFREEHQPDVLQKAGYYLNIITDGRYDRLYAKDDGSGLMIRARYIDQLLEADHPVSRGTLEQIYLALRLALIEHLDSGREVLPLFLDEVLVNWDGMRLQKGIKILEKIAEQRQVFLFTCHKWLAEALGEYRYDQILLEVEQL
ncbi:MAG TPA: AAA family ATPase [Thermoanaerobacterales bacterium]|nr:AAA family ATPase [Thermoanaerobacterales bacterium]